jgi:hypothetical protein
MRSVSLAAFIMWTAWLAAADRVAAAEEQADPTAPRPGLKRLAPEYQVWIDPKQKQVVMNGTVVLRRGPLELFACLKNTKEHEAVVAVDSKAYVVHAALLACGATTGNPARFLPEFQPARGTEIEVLVSWTDDKGKRHEMDARQWIRDVRTGQAMKYPWVFGGSGFWKDPADGKSYYQAEEGDFICISNFTTAMLDLPIESSQANATLLFEAFTDHIPPDGTKVVVTLKPKFEAKAEGAKPQAPPKPAS